MSKKLDFFLQLSKTHAEISRRLISQGLGFGEFALLYHLNQSPEGKLRRIDLADKVGLTASGITRMLIPLEKLKIIERNTDEMDARARFASLTPAGKELLENAIAILSDKAEDILPEITGKKLEEFTEFLSEIRA
jgi:DNA-binding MarR family transcriptional regulator